jgi:hypothetical protein
MIKLIVAVVLGLFPGLAMAQTACPTANDLAQGIRVDRSGGYTEVFRAGGQGIIAVEGFIDRKLEYNLELAGGFQLLSYSGNVGESPVADDGLTYDYGVPHADLPGPVANGRWQSAVTLTGIDGPYAEPQLYAYGPLEQISIGDCSYAMILVTIAYQNDINYIETVQFLPDLGISVLVRQGDDNTEPTEFTIQRIGVARQ